MDEEVLRQKAPAIFHILNKFFEIVEMYSKIAESNFSGEAYELLPTFISELESYAYLLFSFAENKEKVLRLLNRILDVRSKILLGEFNNLRDLREIMLMLSEILNEEGIVRWAIKKSAKEVFERGYGV